MGEATAGFYRHKFSLVALEASRILPGLVRAHSANNDLQLLPHVMAEHYTVPYRDPTPVPEFATHMNRLLSRELKRHMRPKVSLQKNEKPLRI
jgi:hypothetical protein